MLRHHSLGSAELAALMGAWRPQAIAGEPRSHMVVVLDPATVDNGARERADAPDAPEARQEPGARP